MRPFALLIEGVPGSLWPICGAVFGAVIGSWIATAVLRWPAGRSTARGRSACDSCGARLGALQLVPIVSWSALRGRCSRCGGRIDPLHPATEVAAALIGSAALWIAPGAAGLAGAAFGWALLLLALLDARHLWLPDRVTLPLALAGLGVGAAGLAPALSDRVWGAAAGWALLALVRWGYRRLRGRDGMGGGDPKLFGAIGAWLGWAALPAVLLIASGGGLAVALLRAARGERITPATTLPLGTLLAGAALLAWCAGQIGSWP